MNWKYIRRLAQPEMLYQISSRFIVLLTPLSLFLLTTGLIWGFIFAPADYQQGQSYRIIYLHVPAAIWSMGIYATMGIAAFIGLVWQSRLVNLSISAMTPIGMVYTLIALISGACWGKPMWGTWWIWDARLTSELILLFLYMGTLALSHAFPDRRRGGKAAALLVLVGMFNLPIIHYSVEWWNTLHQGSTRLQTTLDVSMRYPLRWMILAFFCLFITLTLLRLRTLILDMERRRPWVIQLATKRRI